MADSRMISRTGIFFVFIFLFSLVFENGSSFAKPVVEGETSGESIRVTTENRSTIRSNPRMKRIDAVVSRESSEHIESASEVRRNSGQRPSNAGSRITVGPTAMLRCSMGTLWCEVPILADRPRESVPDSQPQITEARQVVTEAVEIVITASDLLELIPSTPQIVMDQGPFGLKNAHTNFYASDHQVQTVTEAMFGQEVTIVATPIEYRWDYGDGSSLVTESPGRPVDVFNTETETSHQYTESGAYTVTLTTVFEGTYQVDGGPVQAVSSTVTQQADPVDIQIWRAVTRNVGQTCSENSGAWGC